MEARHGSRNSEHAHATMATFTPHSRSHNYDPALNEEGPTTKAVLTELQQLHNLKALAPGNGNKMTHIEKNRDLVQYLMFLKKKRNGTIKGRGCADGRKQREYTKKEDTSAPIGTTLSCVIDAEEGRDVLQVSGVL
jgi:hypothetical protein